MTKLGEIAALCHCGKPWKHIGGHRGIKGSRLGAGAKADPKPTSPAGRNTKLRTLVESEIKHCHANISRLKGEIQTRKDDLLTAEAKLKPLVALLDVYRDLALPAPVHAPVVAQAAPRPPSIPTRPLSPGSIERDSEADFEPIACDFGMVAGWAMQRGIPFKSWDDLPMINDRRTQFELPTLKRNMK